MIRNAATTGGRPAKNEDLTQYIQAFTILEQMFTSLSYGNFIVYGMNTTANGSNFDISSGVIYFDGELCLYNGETNVSLPRTFQKEAVSINSRQHEDGTTKATANSLQIVFNASGTLSFDQDTPRADDRFFRLVSGSLLAPINANNNELTNVWKPLLSDNVETTRVIPEATGTGRFLLLGSFPSAADSQNHLFFISGVEPSQNASAFLSFGKDQGTTAGTQTGTIHRLSGNSDTANQSNLFGVRNTVDSTYEIWIESASTIPSGQAFTSGVITLMGDSFRGLENTFSFEETFTWATLPLINSEAFTDETIATVDDVNSLQTQITDNTNDISGIGIRLRYSGRYQLAGSVLARTGGDIAAGNVSVTEVGTGQFRVFITGLAIQSHFVSANVRRPTAGFENNRCIASIFHNQNQIDISISNTGNGNFANPDVIEFAIFQTGF